MFLTPSKNLFALSNDLFIGPPPGRHVFVGVLRRSRWRGLNWSFLLTAPCNDECKTSNDRHIARLVIFIAALKPPFSCKSLA